MTRRPVRRNEFNFELIMGSVNRRLTAWVLGTGLLAFHAGVFFLTMTAVFFWNAYDRPNDFWAVDLLRRWGAVLILHAVVTVGVTLGLRLLRSADIEEASQQRWSGPPYDQNGVTVGSWRALEGPRTLEAPVASAIITPVTPRSSPGKRLRARATERLAAMRGKQSAEESSAPEGWPEAPARRDPDADELIRQFGSDSSMSDEPATDRARRPGQSRWSWVEASATSWLTKKDAARPEVAEHQRRVDSPPPPASSPDSDEPFAP